MLDSTYCRARQGRLREVMERMRLDRAIVVRPEHVQYLTGFRPHRLMVAAASLDCDGRCVLAAPNAIPDHAVADDVVVFEAQFRSTLRQDQSRAAAVSLASVIRDSGRTRIGIEFSAFGAHLREALGGAVLDWMDLEPDLWSLRRRKDPDELAWIQRAIECTDAMYARARDFVRPGVSELDVYGELHAAAVRRAGESLGDFGNDFQCNSRGGPPRPRRCEAGELYILDLGVSYRGYYSDNCRTFSVGRPPTDEQLAAWRAIDEVLGMVERTVRPGIRCGDLFRTAQEMLDAVRPAAFSHHLGHGIGLFPHEAPHLNPHWDDRFQEGEVFTAEPGLYWEELRAGIRVEDDYLVTADGVRRLSHFPRELGP